MFTRRFLEAFLAVTMIIAMLAACGPAGTPEAVEPTAAPTSEEEPMEEAPTTEPMEPVEPAEAVELEVMEGMALAPLPEGQDWIREAILERLNIDLNLQTISGDQYDSTLNVNLASGDIPDLFMVSPQNLAALSDQGVLLDLGPYLDQLPQAIEFIGGEEALKYGRVQGTQYALPGKPGESPRYFSYWIRQDWLDALGLDTPTTVEELVDVAVAFTEQDPDGNGQNDTFGLSGQGFDAAFTPVFGAYGTCRPGDFILKNGELQSTLIDPAMQDALGFIKEFLATGSVDPELLANSGMMHQDKAFQGQVGIIYVAWSQIWKDQFVDQWQTVNPEAQWAGLSAPQGPGGASSSCWNASPSGLIGFSANLAEEPEKLQAAIDLLNYLGTEEGSYLVQFGIEGRHYELDEEGRVVPTALMDEEGGYFYLYQLMGRDDQTYLYSKFIEQIPYIDFAFDEPYTVIYNSLVLPPEGYNVTDANTFAAQELAKFAYGERPLEEYDEFLDTLQTTFGYSQMLEVADQVEAELTE